MGKNVSKKKVDYGEMVNDTLATSERESTPTPTPTSTDTPKYTPAHVPTLGKGERKTERLQLLVKPSSKTRLAVYAKDHGTSSNEVVQRLIDDLLDNSGY